MVYINQSNKKWAQTRYCTHTVPRAVYYIYIVHEQLYYIYGIIGDDVARLNYTCKALLLLIKNLSNSMFTKCYYLYVI